MSGGSAAGSTPVRRAASLLLWSCSALVVVLCIGLGWCAHQLGLCLLASWFVGLGFCAFVGGLAWWTDRLSY